MYESLDFDDNGLPTGRKFSSDNIPDDIEVVYLYLRISGKPGSYWTTITVDCDAREMDTSSMGVSKYQAIKEGIIAGIVAPFDIGKVPPGHYVVKFSIASTKMAEFEFTIVPKE